MPKLSRRDALLAMGASAAACRVGARTDPMPKPAENPVTQTLPLGFQWRARDPFLFCVHHDDTYPRGNERFGPAASLAGRQLGSDFAGLDGWRMYHGDVVPGFPQHPHRGFETITVVRRGLLDHADSLGAAARYGQGDVQWMTAGRGIVHSEMFPLLDRERDNPVELFQIWLNLPAADKLAEPHFSMLWSPTVPKETLADEAGRTIELTVIAGRFGEIAPPAPPPRSWASRPNAAVAIWALKLAPNARFTLPAAPGTNRSLYVFRGAGVKLGPTAVPNAREAELHAALEVPIENGPEESELLLLQGRPIAEPIAQYGPFVMNSQAEIRQAFEDYRRTQFGGWPWDRDDPVHGAAKERFARRPDGSVERPT